MGWKPYFNRLRSIRGLLRAQQAKSSILSRTPSLSVTGLSSALFSFLLLAVPAIAAPTSPARDTTVRVDAPAQPHTGYPTTREKWRYCPRDGSHQCVELDIPGVTVPDQAAGAPVTPGKSAP